MQKPANYDTTKAYGEFETLALGGHICRILKVEETTSRSGKEMLGIYLDIAEGEQAGYYKKRYEQDDRPEKKWPCIVYQLTQDRYGNASKGFKTFIQSVSKSNPGFDEAMIWGDGFAEHFKGRLVGGAFGREQYINKNGEFKWAVKCASFYPVDAVRKGIETPQDRYHPDYKTPAQQAAENFSASGDDFADIF